jgi:hypothetical protein
MSSMRAHKAVQLVARMLRDRGEHCRFVAVFSISGVVLSRGHMIAVLE